MAKVFTVKDCDPKLIKKKTVTIIGYGAQGHAHAQNLRDSGIKVLVVDLPGTPNYKKAVTDGFKPVDIEQGVSSGDIIVMLLPDETQAIVYKNAVEPNLSRGKMLMFAHGFNIHFGQIVPPKNIDVCMVAPKGPGTLVRSEYVKGGGVPNLVAVYQDASKKALKIALSYAWGIGGARAGVLQTTFAEETETDLFGEQVVLCGGVTELIKAGFDTLVEAGYQPEIAFFECMHEMKLIVDLFYKGGITMMHDVVSNTAEYGGLRIGSRIITDETKKEMKKILGEVQSGEFAREWLLENKVGRPVFNALVRKEQAHGVEVTGKKLRKLMKWLND